MQYIAKPEKIYRNEDPILYELEDLIFIAIHKVATYRVNTRGEKFFQEAIPQTLLAILHKYDDNSSSVAIQSYISGNKEVIEVKE